MALSDPELSDAAIIALGRVGKPAKAAVADLAKIAGADVNRKSPEDMLAREAIEAIEKIGYGSIEAIDALTLRMSRGRSHEAALTLTKLGQPGADALIRLAAKYFGDKRPERHRRYGEAYSVLASGMTPLSPDVIPVFEKYIKRGDEHADIAARALASVGPAAKPLLINLLDHDDPEVRAHAATGLGMMNFHAQAARRFRNAMVEDPVSADEVFSKLMALFRNNGGKQDWRFFYAMARIDKERMLADPGVRQALQEAWEDTLRKVAQQASKKYTVWVYQNVNGRWVRDESRTYVGDEKTSRNYVADVQKFHPRWMATSNLPEVQE